MNKNVLMTAVIVGILLSSCQKTDVPETEFSRAFTTIGKFELIGDEITDPIRTNTENSVLRRKIGRGYEQSIPIYRYYRYEKSYSDHYYGTENNPNEIFINKRKYSLEPWWGFNIERKDNNVYDPDFMELARYYSVSTNDHMLTIGGVVDNNGYKYETALGRIYTRPRLGTVPLWEYYSPVDRDHLYVWSNTEIIGFANNPGAYAKRRMLGFVYPGLHIDRNKIADSFEISQLSSQPCYVTMKINAREGGVYHTLTYVYNFGGGGSARFTLPSPYVIVSIDMTIQTPINKKTYTAVFHIDATEMSYLIPLTSDLKIGVNLFIHKETYYAKSIEIYFTK